MKWKDLGAGQFFLILGNAGTVLGEMNDDKVG